MLIVRQIRKAAGIAFRAGPRGLVRKVATSLRRGGVRDLVRVARSVWGSSTPRLVAGAAGTDRDDYRLWATKHDTLTTEVRSALERAAAALPLRPTVSVVMPTYNTRKDWLIEAIESIRAQIYPHWELCIADDASREPHVAEVLRSYAALDSRIRVVVRPKNGHISATTNSALELVTGEWIALLDHDDLLPPHALFWVAKAVNDHPSAQMIYSDEDRISEAGERVGAYFKPDWNPDLFLSQNMFSHLGVFRTELARAVGGLRVGFEGSQDYDLALRCSERVRRQDIVHIPRVLYHWRVHQDSTAMSHDAKPYAMSAGQRALEEHLQRRGIDARCEPIPAGFRVHYGLGAPLPRTAIVLTGQCRSGRGGSAAHARAILDRTDYPGLEVYVTDDPPATAGEKVTVISGSNAQSRLQEALAKARQGQVDVICILDARLTPARADWMRELATQASRDNVGAAGPMIVSASGKIESAGVMLMPDQPLRAVDAHSGLPRGSIGYGGRAQLAQHLSAVRSACLVLRTELLAELLESVDVSTSDWGVEACICLRARGLDIVWTPFAELVTQETLPALSVPLLHSLPHGRDPAYNPNLYGDAADFSLAWPPRLEMFP